MITIAQQLGITEFPFHIKDKNGNIIYTEYTHGHCMRYDSFGNIIYAINSDGKKIYNQVKSIPDNTKERQYSFLEWLDIIKQ